MGPLPRLYTRVIVSVVLALCVAVGVWLAERLSLPLGGVGVGLAAGALLAFLATRDFSRQHPTR